MSSLDDTYERLVAFRRALAEFNATLRASVSDMAKHHEEVAPLWEDQNRQRYDAQWEELRQEVVRYLRDRGPRSLDFLDEKTRALAAYLQGN